MEYKLVCVNKIQRIIYPQLPANNSRFSINNHKYTGEYYWPVMIDYVKKNTPISCHSVDWYSLGSD